MSISPVMSSAQLLRCLNNFTWPSRQPRAKNSVEKRKVRIAEGRRVRPAMLALTPIPILLMDNAAPRIRAF